MLKNWQIKYPNSFLPYPNIDIDLDIEDQAYLSELLLFIENAGPGLLNEAVLNHILPNSLNTNYYLSNIKESLEILIQSIPLSTELLTFLVSTKNPRICAEFISTSLKNWINITESIHFLSQLPHLDGLSRAMNIFERSDFGFEQEHLEKLKILSQILANPLCQTIFDARLRGFSDYTIASDPLQSLNTNEIIDQICESDDKETQIQIFFDYFTQFRPFPPSQKYMVYVNVADKIEIELQSPDINTSLQDIKNIFDQIKYRVARDIESEDLYSTRTYQDLMTQIWSELNQVHHVPGYQGFFTNVKREQTSPSPSYFCGK